MQATATPILKFDQVCKSFESKRALSQLSFQISAGMVVGLLGQNGAGKSTLIRSALGIVAVDSGQVQTLGENPLQLTSDAKQQIGYVAQQSFGYEGFTVERALDLHRSFYPDWDIALEQDWLQRFELDGQQQVQRLSIGQRQSLALIMAMAYRPKLLVLDEPVASLDPIARRQFMADLFDLALDSGSAVLFSSHITSDLERVASHVALMRHGEMLLFKEIDALREEVRLIKFDQSPPQDLPAGLTILKRKDCLLLVDGYQGQAFTTPCQVESLNLEQLFLELHQ